MRAVGRFLICSYSKCNEAEKLHYLAPGTRMPLTARTVFTRKDIYWESHLCPSPR